MKICFLTDLHIDLEGVLNLGIDTRLNFQTTISKIKNCEYDLIILGGDLCNNTGDESIYQWIKEQLKDIKAPVLAISGNHDDSTMIAKIFGMPENLNDDELYFLYKAGGYNLIFLDTAKGKMSDNQWDWLENCVLQEIKEVFIFMHHPPVLAGALHMEPRYSFKQTNRFEQLFITHADKDFHIVTGHYHMERTIITNNAKIYITPSTFIQIDPDYVEFKPQHGFIGYREFFIDKQASIRTDIVYFEI